jgi:ABC-2 type transport system ATP-binding protein
MIKLEHVSKYYGTFPAITDISFEVEKGEILGFLGPNGAGKTTTMKILTGFLPATAGTATVAGYDVMNESVAARRHIGYLPETVPLYLDMAVNDYLRFMGRIRGMSTDRVRKRIDDVIGICNIEDYRSTHIGKLSKGFRQRVGIAQAILHDPDVLILDEPTIGIDPIQVVETRELIRGLAGEHTVVVSTHILPEVSAICGRVIIIHEGQIVAVDTPDNLASRLRGSERVELDVRGRRQDVTRVVEGVEGVIGVEVTTTVGRGYSSYVVEAREGVEVRSDLAAAIVEAELELLRLEAVGMSLEEIFLRLTVEEEHPAAEEEAPAA